MKFRSLHPQFKNLNNDSQEFIRFFLQDINNELNRISNKNPYNVSIPQSNKISMFNEYKNDCFSKENSIITDLFIGFMSFEFLCSCGSKDFAFGQFLDLPLLFEDEITPQYDIYSLIKSNILRNEIIKVNDICKDCEKICDRQQKIRIANLPQLLILSIQRFNNFNQKKNNTKISFNEVLDLNEVIDNEIFDNSNTNYRLWGIIYHKGNNLNNGHYFSYIKIQGNWFCFDDKNIINDIPDFNSSDVNTLFFTRINN
jgi:ubiquitin C-terminal hydrolase